MRDHFVIVVGKKKRRRKGVAERVHGKLATLKTLKNVRYTVDAGLDGSDGFKQLTYF